MNLASIRQFWTNRSTRYVLVGAAFVVLLFFLYVGFELRMRDMYSVDDALLYQSDYDEGVHVSAAQLMLQGFVPYRDFLFLQPPFALFLFATILKFHFVPWGDATAFVLARYAAIACGLVTLLAVFEIARRLGGLLAALLAVGVLAIDAQVIQTDRRAMLEPYSNALCVLAVLCYLVALGRERMPTPWLIAAGVLGAFAALTKALVIVSLAAIGVYAAARVVIAFFAARKEVRARLRELFILVVSAAIAAALVSGYFVLTAPEQFFKQVYLIHFVRPPDGTVEVSQRFTEILGYTGSHLTIYLAVAGLAILLLRVVLRRDAGQWGLIVLWTIGILVLFATSRTYFPHYFAQLAVPLAIVAGAVLSRGTQPAALGKLSWQRALLLVVQIGVAIFLVVTNVDAARAQFDQAQAVATMRDVNLRAVSRYLSTQTPLNAVVLGFEPIYAFTGSREPAGNAPGHFLIDSYGFIIHTNVGMEDAWLPEPSGQDIWGVVHQADAQARIVEIAKRADYVVIDRQARWELNPEVITAITAGRRQVFESGKIAVFARE
jgi:4-amino-4-deoxy-L-arabinose transferase-like glycosyltransferase